MVCKTSSLIALKYTAFHYVTTRFNCVTINRNSVSRPWFPSLNQISELVWNSKSYEAGAPSNNTSEDEGGFEEEPRVSHLQPDQPTTRGHTSSSSFS